jgi:hypothetical protein
MMPQPFFLENHIFSGRKGGEARYYMQNVMDAQKKTRKSKFGTLEGAYSGAPILTMVSLEEYERKKYGRTFNQIADEAAKTARVEAIAEKERALEDARYRAREDKRFKENQRRLSEPPCSIHWFACFSKDGLFSNHLLTFQEKLHENEVRVKVSAKNPTTVFVRLEPVTPEMAQHIINNRPA